MTQNTGLSMQVIGQVIGVCRFSYPAIGGFQVEHDSIQARKAYLWAPERLEERFRLFETISLPALRAQTDPDFQFLIVTGDDFPEPHAKRLRALIRDLPQARILPLPPARMRLAMKDVINGHRDPNQLSLQFRLDDDDAVTVDFVAHLRQTARQCAGLLDQHRSFAIDGSVGYYARVDANGIASTDPLYRPYDAAGLGICTRPGTPATIFNFNHKKLPQRMPGVTFSDQPMYVRTHNEFNDSRQKPVQQFNMTPLSPERAQEFKDRFAIDIDHLRQVYAG